MDLFEDHVPILYMIPHDTPRKWVCLNFFVPKPMVHHEYSPLLKVIWGPFLHGQTHPDR